MTNLIIFKPTEQSAIASNSSYTRQRILLPVLPNPRAIEKRVAGESFIIKDMEIQVKSEIAYLNWRLIKIIIYATSMS